MKPYFSDQDIRENKLKAGLGYLVFFLPLVLCKDSKLGRHCANQGLASADRRGAGQRPAGHFRGHSAVGFVIRMAIKLVWFARAGHRPALLSPAHDQRPRRELPYIGSLKILS